MDIWNRARVTVKTPVDDPSGSVGSDQEPAPSWYRTKQHEGDSPSRAPRTPAISKSTSSTLRLVCSLYVMQAPLLAYAQSVGAIGLEPMTCWL